MRWHELPCNGKPGLMSNSLRQGKTFVENCLPPPHSKVTENTEKKKSQSLIIVLVNSFILPHPHTANFSTNGIQAYSVTNVIAF